MGLGGALGGIGSSADQSKTTSNTETTDKSTAVQQIDDSNVNLGRYDLAGADNVSFTTEGLAGFSEALQANERIFDNLVDFGKTLFEGGQDVVTEGIAGQQKAIDEVSSSYATANQKIDLNNMVLFASGIGALFLILKLRKK